MRYDVSYKIYKTEQIEAETKEEAENKLIEETKEEEEIEIYNTEEAE